MRVSCHLPAQCGFALERPPSPGERQKKALLTRQPACHAIGLTFQRQDIGVMRNQQSGQVGDIFSQDLLAVDA